MTTNNFSPNFIRPAAPVRPVAQYAAPTESPSYIQFLSGLTARCSVIYLDMGTTLRGGFEPMIRTLVSHLKKYNRRLEVGQAVLRDLRKLSVDHPAAVTALESLNALQTVGLVHHFGNPNADITPHAEILKAVAENVWNTDILVLTQSAELASDISLFGRFTSIRPTTAAVVKRLRNDYGQLGDFVETPDASQQQPAPTASANVLSRLGL